MFTYSSTVIPVPLLVIYLPYYQINMRKPGIYYFQFLYKETYVTGGNSYTFQFLTQGLTIILGQIKCEYVASSVHSLKYIYIYYQGETPLHVSLERHKSVTFMRNLGTFVVFEVELENIRSPGVWALSIVWELHNLYSSSNIAQLIK